MRQCAKRLKKEKGEWRRLAQCLGAITRDNQIKENVTKEEKDYIQLFQKSTSFFLMLHSKFQINAVEK